MTDRNAVRDILYRAGAEGASITAARAYASPVQGAAVMIRQFEDSVLPRRFEMDFDSGARLVIEVAERQVLHLCDVRMPGGRAAALQPGTLGPDHARALGDLLNDVCRGSGTVRISAGAASAFDPAAGGVSLEALREVSGLPAPLEPQPGTTTWIEGILEKAKIEVRSAVLIDVDEAHVISGSKDEAEALADWAVEMLDVFLAEDFPLAPELETKGAVTFAPQQNGAHILLAGLRGQFLLALVSGPDMAGTLAAWRRASEREIDGFLAAG
ncbi:hypothetical protein [Roseicyclus sp.]|uniref:hypothetical protein n=1 Tax=Roseicyclus sp. TaxID=1914329 RepID=UPI003FA01E21